jgi:raffinose/stachyose/melibiose transport system permease protein
MALQTETRLAPAVQGGHGAASLGWFAVPALVFFTTFALIPLVGVVFLSFTRWNGLGSITLTGFDSWVTALTSPVTMNALWVTVKIMFFSIIVQLPISLLLGVFTAGTQRYRALLAVIYFVPLLLSSAAEQSRSPTRRCWIRTSAWGPA